MTKFVPKKCKYIFPLVVKKKNPFYNTVGNKYVHLREIITENVHQDIPQLRTVGYSYVINTKRTNMEE